MYLGCHSVVRFAPLQFIEISGTYLLEVNFDK